MIDFETLVANEVPKDSLSKFARIVGSAYQIVSTQLNDVPVLSHRNKKMARGWIRYLAVNNALSMAVESGDLTGFTVEWRPVSSMLERLYLKCGNVSIQTQFLPSLKDDSGEYKLPRIGPTRVPDVSRNQEAFPFFDEMTVSLAQGRLEFFLIHGSYNFELCHLAFLDSCDSDASYRWVSPNYALTAVSEDRTMEYVEEFSPEIIRRTLDQSVKAIQ